MTWTDTGVAAATLAAGKMVGVDVGGRSLVLVRTGERFDALEGFCSHEGGSLADGEFRAGRVICPIHQAAFDPSSGRVLADPDGVEPPTGVVPPVSHYSARVVRGMIQVDLPELVE